MEVLPDCHGGNSNVTRSSDCIDLLDLGNDAPVFPLRGIRDNFRFVRDIKPLFISPASRLHIPDNFSQCLYTWLQCSRHHAFAFNRICHPLLNHTRLLTSALLDKNLKLFSFLFASVLHAQHPADSIRCDYFQSSGIPVWQSW